MAIENVVIAYKADINDIKRQVTLLQRLNKITAQQLGKEFTKGATIVRNELSKITTSAKAIQLPLGGSTKQLRQFTTVLRSTNGQLATVRQTVAGTGKNIKVLNTTVSRGATVTRTFAQNLGTLLKRASLTIPVWFALRQGISSVFRTIRDGLTAIADFDRALQKARRNLQGSTDVIESNFQTLRKEVTQLSIETGRSVEDITNAFQKFATVGFDFETSLAGANSATKLSILLFGDATTTANAFARSMRVLIDESENARPASEQLAEVMALTAELWETNAFELNELTQSLEKFAPVAKTAGFSAEETVKVLSALSTAGLRGGRAGRLLRTSLTRLVTSTDKLATSLGIKVNPEVDRTFDVFLRTLDVLAETRAETGKVAPEFEKVVKSIFGLRSSDAIKGLIALRENLQAVLDTTGDVAEFDKEFDNVNKQIFQLTAQFKNLNREIGKAFVIGLVNGEDYRDSLEKIVELQTELIDKARILGSVLRNTFQAGATAGFRGGLVGVISDQLDASLIEASRASIALGQRITKGLEGELSKTQISDLIKEIETGEIDIDNKVAPKIIEQLQKQFDNATNLRVPVDLDVSTQDTAELFSTEQQNKLIQDLIKDQIERLKLQGATESQLLKIEDKLRRQFDINDDILDQKQRELEIERKISEEQRLRTQLSSESVKLFRIAQEQGVGVAQAIGEVLAGQKDFNLFLRQGGKEVEIFKKEFADIFEQQQALRFFRGERVTGQPGLRGGTRIPIREEILQRGITPSRATVDFQRARAGLGLPNVQQTNTINITNNITSDDPEQIARIVEDTIIKGYQNPNSRIAKEAKDFTLNI